MEYFTFLLCRHRIKTGSPGTGPTSSSSFISTPSPPTQSSTNPEAWPSLSQSELALASCSFTGLAFTLCFGQVYQRWARPTRSGAANAIGARRRRPTAAAARCRRLTPDYNNNNSGSQHPCRLRHQCHHHHSRKCLATTCPPCIHSL